MNLSNKRICECINCEWEGTFELLMEMGGDVFCPICESSECEEGIVIDETTFCMDDEFEREIKIVGE